MKESELVDIMGMKIGAEKCLVSLCVCVANKQNVPKALSLFSKVQESAEKEEISQRQVLKTALELGMLK